MADVYYGDIRYACQRVVVITRKVYFCDYESKENV